MNHIELFAGCGGLTLGLETAGFDLLLANELSPMASETFAFNHLNANLEKGWNIDKVLWISSQYGRCNIKDRLRENPNDAVGLRDYSDLVDSEHDSSTLRRSLLVGSVVDLNSILDMDDNSLISELKNGLGDGGVDLISGGPPCQSFSLAGLREHTHSRNDLPIEFARFVNKIRPKVALLENVSGILRPFKINGGNVFAWFEVAKAFAQNGYIPLCLHVNAKHIGASQNRPRFIMIALRLDVYKSFVKNSNEGELISALKPSFDLYNDISKGIDPLFGCIKCYDVDKDRSLFRNSILSNLSTRYESTVTVKDAIDDLRSPKVASSEYVDSINTCYTNTHGHPLDKYINHELRKNGGKVRARFRLYQILNKLPKDHTKHVTSYLKSGGTTTLNPSTIKALGCHWMLDISGEKIAKASRQQILNVLSRLFTKKQTQKALVASKPAPATLSIPDDTCHYHESVRMQRTLTVREMARIQSFPDWYQIKSKVTTGGQMRKFEVPQYTQIGNAVPPLLGIALGVICKGLINISRQDGRN